MGRWLLLVHFLVLGCSNGDRRAIGGGGVETPTTPGADAAAPDLSGPDPSPNGGCDKMDILFVIDDSESMTEEQDNLIRNFRRFIEVVDNFRTDDDRPLDYRIGVTTTSRPLTVRVNTSSPPMMITQFVDGPDGALLRHSWCDMPRPWIETADPDRTGSFSCIADVGVDGPAIEMPLQMVERALTDRVADGQNAGFIRDDALLAVVVLTDEDDCSQDANEVLIEGATLNLSTGCDPNDPALVPLEHFLTTFDEVKGSRGRWALAAIAGTVPGSCASVFGDAYEASRLRTFTEMAGSNARLSSICEGDLSGALMEALGTFDAACESFPPLI